MIVPLETGLTAAYWSAARTGEVLLQRCLGCAHVWHPPAPMCPRCRSTGWTWHPASGTAVLVSWTRVVHPAHAQVAAAVPYLVGLVRLTEGPLYVCGLDVEDESALTDGAPITIALGTAAGGMHLPVGRSAESGASGRDRRA